jgi:hypothetical protein
MTGQEPRYVDHIDTCKSNNKWSNLRECSKSDNGGNRGKTVINSTGYKNIGWSDERQRWVVQVRSGGTYKVRRCKTLAGAIALQRLWSCQLFNEFARSA